MNLRKLGNLWRVGLVVGGCLWVPHPGGWALAAGEPESSSVQRAQALWVPADPESPEVARGEPGVRPDRFILYSLDEDGLGRALAGAPPEFTPEAARPLEVALPMPDGSMARFEVLDSPVMAPELAEQFPRIRTFRGQGVDDPWATLRMDLTPLGFHAQVLSPSGAVYIDPYTRGQDRFYAVYAKRDLPRRGQWRCHGAVRVGDHDPPLDPPAPEVGETLRIFRFACAATGEYTIFHGGTVQAGMSAITTAVNRINGVLEVEIAARLELVANNHLIVYTNPFTDPYTNNDPFAMLEQNQRNLDQMIGNANYDIGHVLGTEGGGLGGLGVACWPGFKAWGVTGLPFPIGDPFYIDYVSHELGHQFGANHSFNGVGWACQWGREAGRAFEPGSGSTIMGYSGLCGPNDDLQVYADPYYLWVSFAEMRGHIVSGIGSCARQVPTGNHDPVVDAGPDRTIPHRTPFRLTADAYDPDNDPLTYSWEQRDLGPAQPAWGLGSGDNGLSPLFRSLNPGTSPTRTFPHVSTLMSNTPRIGEILPTTDRFVRFRVTVRDNRPGGGGVGFDNLTVTVTTAAGPFVVFSPNGNEVWSGRQLVRWLVAGTDAPPVSAAEVNIRLSTDGGETFPIVLAEGVPNSGVAEVVLPNIATARARVMVEAADNIFFDISDRNFTIEPSGCYPDCDGSGSLDFFDFLCFQNAFLGGNPYADCNGDGALDFFDFLCFQNEFLAGCP